MIVKQNSGGGEELDNGGGQIEAHKFITSKHLSSSHSYTLLNMNPVFFINNVKKL